MFLSDMKENQRAKVVKNSICGGFGTRLRDLGFYEGEEVLCVKRAVFSSPILYRVKGSLVALRKEDAQKIEAAL